jgi:Tropinone reductase 1
VNQPRRALVTGASRGIGVAIAQRLAADGFDVTLVARTAEALSAVAESIRAAGGTATVLACDLTDPAALEATLSASLDAKGPVSVLVNNAGGNIRRVAEDYTVAEWDQLMALALRAPFRLAQLVFPGMREAGLGRIVNVGSVAGMRALGTGAPYAAAKAGLAQLTKNLAREWGPHGITSNLVAPWYVRTPLTEELLDDPAYAKAVLDCTPTGRLGTPADVAAAVSFLVGPESGWINGAELPLDGGFTSSGFFPPAGRPPRNHTA